MSPIEEVRPWGKFRRFAKNEPVTVKILYVSQGQEFSLQKHEHRGEFWRVLSGEPLVTIGDEVTVAKRGDEFIAKVGVAHRISAPEGDVEVLEISTGAFDEGDIVRLEDDYGRK